MSVASLANKTLTLERQTQAADGWGSPKDTYTPTSRVTGRLQPVSGDDAMIHGRPDLRITHRFYVSGNPDIRSGDRLDDAGAKLYVVDLGDHRQAFLRFLRVGLEERDA